MEGIEVRNPRLRVAAAKNLRRAADAVEAGRTLSLCVDGQRVRIPEDVMIEVDADGRHPAGEVVLKLVGPDAPYLSLRHPG